MAIKFEPITEPFETVDCRNGRDDPTMIMSRAEVEPILGTLAIHDYYIQVRPGREEEVRTGARYGLSSMIDQYGVTWRMWRDMPSNEIMAWAPWEEAEVS